MQEAILNLPPEEKTRVMTAVNTLVEDNPDAAEQLEKIARIKKEKPLTWKMLLLKLKNY